MEGEDYVPSNSNSRQCQKHNVTAVIYDKRGRPVSIGKNSYAKTHTVQARYAARAGYPKRIYLHAEIAAILKCTDLSRAYRIFVSRYTKNGKPALAKPCEVCELAIREAGIKIVEYTTSK